MAGVTVSSYCPFFTAHKKAAKKNKATGRLHPINRYKASIGGLNVDSKRLQFLPIPAAA
jgi:hypothetical protein